MRRRLIYFRTILVLTLCIWGHVSELFDHWDDTFQTGNDVEYSTVIVVLIAGAVIRFAHIAGIVLPLRAFRSPLAGRGGLIYLTAMSLAGAFLLYYVTKLTKSGSKVLASRVVHGSVLYLPFVLGIMIACKA